ncbi:adenine deaminase C-terminal domain-containing protein [Clostridiaceae bacterium M8S5]|nr:adenine deaminase C-terminal domain-containing protein [Clostridiaceae bacterium M8S5]
MVVDLIIKNAFVYNTYFKKFFKENLVVINEKILYVGSDDISGYECDNIVEVSGKYLIPGLIDIHMHIESSMATPSAFSHEIIKNGVTTIVSEPHEIANVFGLDGIKEMIFSGKDCVADIFYGIPSSVPSTNSEFETTGEEIGLEEIKSLAQSENIICLGEVMNYYDVVHKPESKINKIIDYMKTNHPDMPIEGHCPKIMGKDLATYIYRGINSDHTQQMVDTMRERIKMGMFIQIQEKSLKKEIIDFLNKNNLHGNYCFVTDDVMADTLNIQGHLNKIVKKAIELGMSEENAIFAATYTPAMRMNLKDRGALAPGKIADIVLLDSLAEFDINTVYKKGVLVYQKGMEYDYKGTDYRYPDGFYKSVKRKKVTKHDFDINAPIANGSIDCRVIKVSNNTTFTEEEIHSINVKDNKLQWADNGCCLIAVLERYGKNNNIALGLISGDTIKRGSVATTYAHDHHNILVVGKKIDDIVLAVNHVIDNQGGIYVVEDNDIKAKIDLPIGGILSDKSIADIARQTRDVREALLELGYDHYNPIMSLCTNSLPVSQLLKITDKGLIKLSENKIVDLFLEV